MSHCGLTHLVVNIFPDKTGSIEVSLTAIDGSQEMLVNAAAQICAPAVKAFADAILHDRTRCTACNHTAFQTAPNAGRVPKQPS